MSTSDFEEEVKRKRMAFGSLFSGIGGIDLGLERAGMHCLWQVEKDVFCTKVLQKHWPDTPRYGDIRDLDTSALASVDLIAGGFPCQPHSLAGKRQASADERNLWPEFARIIRELRPRWVLCENVVGILSSEDGDFFGKVLGDMATCGYDAQWFVLSAAQFGAPHLRERVFLVAYSASTRPQKWTDTTGMPAEPGSPSLMEDPDIFGYSRQKSTSSRGQCSTIESTSVCKWEDSAETTVYPIISGGSPSYSFKSRMGGMFDGFPSGLDRHRWPAGPEREQYPWEPSRVIQEKAPYQAARLKSLGNAVVPQIAEYIGQWIMECHHGQA
jgi:DNA (cytosine-5)-methyltransferase 1